MSRTKDSHSEKQGPEPQRPAPQGSPGNSQGQDDPETRRCCAGWFQDRLDLGYFLVTLAVLAAVVLAPWLAARWRPRASAELAELLRCITPATYVWPLFLAVAVLAFCVATRAASGFVLNRDQEWGELLLYGSSLLLLLRARVLLGPTESIQ